MLGRMLTGLALLLLAATSAAGATISLTIEPNSQTVQAGTPASVNVNVSGIPPAIGSFDLEMAYNSSVVRASNVSFGPFLGSVGSEAIAGSTFNLNSVEFAEVSLLSEFDLSALQPDSFTLAIVTFDTIGLGISDLTFTLELIDDSDGVKLDVSSQGASIEVVPEPATLILAATGLLGLSLSRKRHASGKRLLPCAVILAMMAGSPLSARADDLSAPRINSCISVYRYGGAASGWITDGAGNFPNGTFKSIKRHIETAQNVFRKTWVYSPGNGYSANVDWVWGGNVEDLADPFDNKNGDIRFQQGAPSGEGDDRPTKDSQGNIGPASRDIALIRKYVADSQCYPIVFVNGLPGAFGMTIVGDDRPVSRTVFVNFNQALQQVPTAVGELTLLDSKAFPKLEDTTTFRRESQISTLGHELGHAGCLDPVVPQPGPNNPRWGDGTGHPPRNQVATPTPEGAGVPGDGRTLYQDLMWFTSSDRTGDEFITLRQAYLINMCVVNLNGVRETYSPSFTVVPNGPSGLASNVIYDGPATPRAEARPEVFIGLTPQSSIDAFSYDQQVFPNGRFPYKFTVDPPSSGLPVTAVRQVVDGGKNAAVYEFTSPPDPAGSKVNTNMLVLDPTVFGLQDRDAIAALTFGPSSRIDPLGNGFLNRGKKVYFSVPPQDASTIDPADVVFAFNDPNLGPNFFLYASRDQLGLKKDDDIDGLCVQDNGNSIYQGPPIDFVLFSLTRNSTSVKDGTFSSADVLLGNGLFNDGLPAGPPVVTRTAASLGLRNVDDLKGLKCFAVRSCDINQDGKVNSSDIQLIFDARNQQTFIGDPRDVDGDRVITTNDARICTAKCDKPNCAP